MEQEIKLNEHNKQEFPPAHTAEHILNGTMVKMWNCGRAVGGHVERKKSKLDYIFPRPLTADEVIDIENRVNEIIVQDLPVSMEYAKVSELGHRFDLNRLPDNVSETVRIVHIGDYDECLCAGNHVEHTSQIGTFRITSTNYENGKLRIVFRLTLPTETIE